MEETNIIEHKSQWRDEWLQWICGFANNQDGVINTGTLFGNNGTLEHQNVTLESTENKADAVLERQNVTLNVTLDDTLKSILQHISHNTKITVKELAEILEVSERHVKRYISYLRDKGFLDRTKNNRYGEWIIKK